MTDLIWLVWYDPDFDELVLVHESWGNDPASLDGWIYVGEF